MGGPSSPVERNNDGESDGHFGSSDGDDEEHEHLGIVVGETCLTDPKSRERHERQVGRVEHELEAHENGDDVATQHDPSEPDGEEKSAGEEVVVEGERVHVREGSFEFTA